MAWSMATYYFGIPVSETHGLIGGIVGASIAAAGLGVIQWSGLIRVLIAIILSPLLGFIGGILVMIPIYRFFSASSPSRMKSLFRNLQRLSSAFMAFSHGRNDAQKPMGVVVMAMALYYGWTEMSVPIWVILTVGITAGIGVAMGGWRIIRTLGMKIAALRPEQGFAAETSAAGILQLASVLGIPVSTTHTITSAIIGVGTMRGFSQVRWGIVIDIVYSWIFTLPATIVLGWIFGHLVGFTA
jgi:PiT family inorganic phosphate transporter